MVAVVGTNASGKSGLGVELALRCGGEIISADSRQVYRGLDLGSGKITPRKRAACPPPCWPCANRASFCAWRIFRAWPTGRRTIIASRGNSPFWWAARGCTWTRVTEGYALSDVKPDLAYREELEALSTPELYRCSRPRSPARPSIPSTATASCAGWKSCTTATRATASARPATGC
jgi:tRNA dimethylallyltransferase